METIVKDNKEEAKRHKEIKAAVTRENTKGDGFLTMASDMEDPGVVNTGVWAFDKLVGGLPRGKYVRISGAPGVGKSTLSLKLIASVQKQGLTCALLNNERRFDPKWAEKNGVDTSKLLVGNFPNLEKSLDFIKSTLGQKCDIIVIDTIQGLAAKGEIETKKGVEKSVEDDTMALIPRKLSQFFRAATASVADSGCCVVLLSQVRMSLGDFIVRARPTGGNAIAHSIMSDIFLENKSAKVFPTNLEGEVVGRSIRTTLLKSTTMDAETGDKGCFSFFTKTGFDSDYDTVKQARLSEIIESVGVGKYSYSPLDEKAEAIQVTAKKEIVDAKLAEAFSKAGLISELQDRMKDIKLIDE